ncbi:MAG: ABC transporter [Gemmatimonadetes bacterium]|nr:ABC transporter [Gemmatimonadota bacterium]
MGEYCRRLRTSFGTIAMNLKLHALSLAFEDKRLLSNVDLTITQGDFVVIRGPSGSGKSSLLRLLNRLAEPASGQITIDDTPVSEVEVTGFRRRVGYVQQTPVMVSGTVFDNLTLPFGYASANTDAPSIEALKDLLDGYNLSDVDLDEDAEKLSVGQKQRVALIRTFLTRPEVILCDEPTSALDPDSREIVEAQLRRINREDRTTIILVTHLAFEAQDVVGRHFSLGEGRLEEAA